MSPAGIPELFQPARDLRDEIATLRQELAAVTAERDAAITVIRAQIAYDDGTIFGDWALLNASRAALAAWREANDA